MKSSSRWGICTGDSIPVKIRKIKEEDYREASSIIKKSIRICWKMRPKELIDEFCRKYNLRNFKSKASCTDYFVAEDVKSGRILGIIGINGNELRTFFVDPNHQNRGIGRMLYNRFENEARKRGIKHIILEGSPLGEPVYRKFGFRKIKTIHKERKGIEYTDAVMRKDL